MRRYSWDSERARVAGIKLMPRDLQILRAVQRHRLLRSTHLVTLLDASRQTTLRRLQLLFHHGYLDRPPAQLDWYAQGSEPMVYALGNRGAAVLAAEGERGGTLRWDKNRNVSRQFLRHTLAVAEVMVAFEVACRGTEGATLIQPEEVLAGAPQAVEVQEGGKPHRLGVEPDRVFGLRLAGQPEHRRLAYFFLEADRGTMPVTRKGLDQTTRPPSAASSSATGRPGGRGFTAAPWHPKLPGPHRDDERGAETALGCRMPVARERLPPVPLRRSRNDSPRDYPQP